jgi:hypothetical protein
LPVIDTIRKLGESGDEILVIEGCPSGTLGFVLGEIGRGESFSKAVQRAIAAGYTEPDARIDLSGLDVARKALILARLIGYRGDLGDVQVDSLVPEALRDVTVSEFTRRLEELDDEWLRSGCLLSRARRDTSLPRTRHAGRCAGGSRCRQRGRSARIAHGNRQPVRDNDTTLSAAARDYRPWRRRAGNGSGRVQ